MSLVLALALVLSMGVTVFAEESTNPTTVTNDEIENNNTNIDVTAGYTAPTYSTGATVYHVVVAWEKTGTITYAGNQYYYDWKVDENNFGYVKNDTKSTNAGWKVDNATVAITVTNKSNAAIKATCSAPAAKTDTGVTGIEGHYGDGTAQTAELKLGSAAPATVGPDITEEQLKGTVREGNATYTITDVKGAISQTDIVIGTISVTIAKDTTSNSEG